ncbi:MAG TPA: hypothetical protein VME22_15165 [Solirubrobacteraceae bacterium]|nr:hypothetical protein [Solirubrobacteraceae bacterium]
MGATNQQTPSSPSGQQPAPSSPAPQPTASSQPTAPTSNQPSPVATGQTTLDPSSGSLAGIVALQGLNAAATEIARAVAAVIGEKGSALIVEDRALGQSDAPHAEITTRFALFERQFAHALSVLAPRLPDQGRSDGGGREDERFVAGAEAGMALASSAVGLLTGVIGMFKTDYSVQGRTVTLNYVALAAAVANRLIGNGQTVVIDGLLDLDGTSTLETLNRLLETRGQLEALVGTVKAVAIDPTSAEIDALNARIKAATDVRDKAAEGATPDKAGKAGASAHAAAASCGSVPVQQSDPDKPDPVAAADKLIAELRAELAELQTPAYLKLKADIAAITALMVTFDGYLAAASTVPAGQKYAPLVAAAIRDVLQTGIRVGDEQVPINHVLYLEVTGAGGDMITRTGLFSSNRRVGLVGAVQASYLLIERSGRVCASDSIGSYSTATFDVKNTKLTWRG